LLFGTVMKRTAFALTLILALVLAAVTFHIPSFASANPMYEIPYPSEPNKEPPTLQVESPQNGTVYASDTTELAFTVTKPDSWNSYWSIGVSSLVPVIGSYIVWVYLDGKVTYHFLDPHLKDVPTANYSLNLDGLASGPHSLKIDVKATTYYENPNPDPYDYLEYFMNVSETVHFTLNQGVSSPSPEPQQETFSTALLATASGASAALIAVGLLLYFKKRKH